MKKINRTIQSKRSPWTIIILLLIAAIALFLLKDSILNNKKIGNGTTTSEPNTTQVPTAAPTQAPPPAASAQATTETPPITAPTATPPPQASTACQKVAEDLHLFFQHLDNQKYIKAYALGKPVQNVLGDIITKLLNNPPVNENEKADILTVLKNSAHLYRTLGSKDLSLLKDILTHEGPTIEQQIASLYAWSTMEKECHNKTINIQLPLAKTYEYAAFFLNTLGGHSYLLRRDTTLRVLTRYYCLLILNDAAKQSLNKYNINLSYHLEAVTKEINSSDFLENQSQYLETLQKIKVGH